MADDATIRIVAGDFHVAALAVAVEDALATHVAVLVDGAEDVLGHFGDCSLFKADSMRRRFLTLIEDSKLITSL